MLDTETAYRAVASRDARFDGWVIVGVTSTGIYCRPSCPTGVRPKREHCRFFPTAASAQQSGFRACKRCRPDASPGSPEWNQRRDLVGRAMRLILDGAIDREGVAGVARRLAVSERQLHRLFVAELGVGPLAVARAQRAQAARTLIEASALDFGDIAFAAGFSSIRQFNDTVREVFALTPSALRTAVRQHPRPPAEPGELSLRLAVRKPFDGPALLDWFSARAVPGLESVEGREYRRALVLPHGAGHVALELHEDHVLARVRLEALTDLSTAVSRCRRVLDLDADPVAISDVLGSDPRLAPLVRARPGVRSPGAVDGLELGVRAVLGQQVSLAAARTFAGRLVETYGDLTSDFEGVGLTRARVKTLHALRDAVKGGDIVLDPGADREETHRRLVALSGVGPWTADYIVMRALSDPDVLVRGDLGLRRGATRLGIDLDDQSRWGPFRSYAAHYLWMAQ